MFIQLNFTKVFSTSAETGLEYLFERLKHYCMLKKLKTLLSSKLHYVEQKSSSKTVGGWFAFDLDGTSLKSRHLLMKKAHYFIKREESEAP